MIQNDSRFKKHRRSRVALLLVCAMTMVVSALSALAAQNSAEQNQEKNPEEKRVAAIEITGEINRGMRRYVVDELNVAAKEKADAVVLIIDTPGGFIYEAGLIKQAILDAPQPIYAFVKGKALSAGVLIALSADKLYMAPGSTIGSAETIPNDEKTLSAWTGELRATAQLHGRDGEVYAAMADKRIAIPGVTQEGALLNLSAQKAAELGAIDGLASGPSEAAALGLSVSPERIATVQKGMSLPVRFSQFITSNIVSSLLFSLAFMAMIIEIFTPGFGVFGIISIASFALYFGGGLIAGYSQWWTIVLFALGVGLLLAELAVPGFGLLGIAGIISIGLALFFNARDLRQFVTSLSIAVLTCAVVVPIALHVSKKAGLMNKIVLSDTLNAESGYVSHAEDHSLVGLEGVAITTLRPSGIVRIQDLRLDAVSLGEFIPKEEKVRVVRQESGKVLVEKIDA